MAISAKTIVYARNNSVGILNFPILVKGVTSALVSLTMSAERTGSVVESLISLSRTFGVAGGAGHQLFRRGGFTRELARDAPFMQHDHAIRKPQDFGQFR